MALLTPRSKTKKTPIEVSDKFRNTYKEVPPFAVDPETGDILNKTTEVQLVKSDPIDIQADVDSYFDSVDLKTNIVRLSRQGIDPTVALNDTRNALYADLSQLPDNINDWKNFFAGKAEEKAKYELQLKALEAKKAEEAAAQAKSLDDLVAAKVAAALAGKDK